MLRLFFASNDYFLCLHLSKQQETAEHSPENCFQHHAA
jgi:hypothetical protein